MKILSAAEKVADIFLGKKTVIMAAGFLAGGGILDRNFVFLI